MKKVIFLFALLAGLLTSAPTLRAQIVDTSCYITLTVAKDSTIKLNFKSASNGRYIRIVSGSTIKLTTANTDWYRSKVTVTAKDTTMTVYGNEPL